MRGWCASAGFTENISEVMVVRVDGVSEEIRAKATFSGDVKESVCNGEWNVILPSTQSINGLKWVSQLCPSTVAQLESNRVT